MRLGLLGPAARRERELQRAIEFLIQDARVERGIYLGIDDALDRALSTRAERLVGPDAAESAVFRRATASCLHGAPDQIEHFLTLERDRRAFSVLRSLPGPTTRTIEMLNGKLAVIVYDKSELDEEDILAATLLVFGRSQDRLIKRVGRRWFLSPGGYEAGGMMLLDDEDGFIRVRSFDGACRETGVENLVMERGPRVRVQGE